MIGRSAAAVALIAGALLAGCAYRIGRADLGTGSKLDGQLVKWCKRQPNHAEQSCRCWPGALRAEGLTDQDLQDLLIWVGAVRQTSDWGLRDPAAMERAAKSCGLRGSGAISAGPALPRLARRMSP